MKYLILILSIALFTLFQNNSFAAYPLQTQHMSTPAATASVSYPSFHGKISTAIHRLTTPLPAASNNEKGGGALGIVSFGLGLAGLALFLATGIAPFLGLLGIACGIGAIVTGAMGFNKRDSGLAIAGFVLGVLEVLVVVLIIALIIAFIGALE